MPKSGLYPANGVLALEGVFRGGGTPPEAQFVVNGLPIQTTEGPTYRSLLAVPSAGGVLAIRLEPIHATDSLLTTDATTVTAGDHKNLLGFGLEMASAATMGSEGICPEGPITLLFSHEPMVPDSGIDLLPVGFIGADTSGNITPTRVATIRKPSPFPELIILEPVEPLLPGGLYRLDIDRVVRRSDGLELQAPDIEFPVGSPGEGELIGWAVGPGGQAVEGLDAWIGEIRVRVAEGGRFRIPGLRSGSHELQIVKRGLVVAQIQATVRSGPVPTYLPHPVVLEPDPPPAGPPVPAYVEIWDTQTPPRPVPGVAVKIHGSWIVTRGEGNRTLAAGWIRPAEDQASLGGVAYAADRAGRIYSTPLTLKRLDGRFTGRVDGWGLPSQSLDPAVPGLIGFGDTFFRDTHRWPPSSSDPASLDAVDLSRLGQVLKSFGFADEVLPFEFPEDRRHILRRLIRFQAIDIWDGNGNSTVGIFDLPSRPAPALGLLGEVTLAALRSRAQDPPDPELVQTLQSELPSLGLDVPFRLDTHEVTLRRWIETGTVQGVRVGPAPEGADPAASVLERLHERSDFGENLPPGWAMARFPAGILRSGSQNVPLKQADKMELMSWVRRIRSYPARGSLGIGTMNLDPVGPHWLEFPFEVDPAYLSSRAVWLQSGQGTVRLPSGLSLLPDRKTLVLNFDRSLAPGLQSLVLGAPLFEGRLPRAIRLDFTAGPSVAQGKTFQPIPRRVSITESTPTGSFELKSDLPPGLTLPQILEWHYGDRGVVDVGPDGSLRLIRPGETLVTMRAASGTSRWARVTVDRIPFLRSGGVRGDYSELEEDLPYRINEDPSTGHYLVDARDLSQDWRDKVVGIRLMLKSGAFVDLSFEIRADGVLVIKTDLLSLMDGQVRALLFKFSYDHDLGSHFLFLRRRIRFLEYEPVKVSVLIRDGRERTALARGLAGGLQNISRWIHRVVPSVPIIEPAIDFPPVPGAEVQFSIIRPGGVEDSAGPRTRTDAQGIAINPLRLGPSGVQVRVRAEHRVQGRFLVGLSGVEKVPVQDRVELPDLHMAAIPLYPILPLASLLFLVIALVLIPSRVYGNPYRIGYGLNGIGLAWVGLILFNLPHIYALVGAREIPVGAMCFGMLVTYGLRFIRPPSYSTVSGWSQTIMLWVLGTWASYFLAMFIIHGGSIPAVLIDEAGLVDYSMVRLSTVPPFVTSDFLTAGHTWPFSLALTLGSLSAALLVRLTTRFAECGRCFHLLEVEKLFSLLHEDEKLRFVEFMATENWIGLRSLESSLTRFGTRSRITPRAHVQIAHCANCPTVLVELNSAGGSRSEQPFWFLQGKRAIQSWKALILLRSNLEKRRS